MFQASHKRWEVAILILINTSALIKFSIVKMDNWLNISKCPCWDSIRDPFASEANPPDYATSSMVINGYMKPFTNLKFVGKKSVKNDATTPRTEEGES